MTEKNYNPNQKEKKSMKKQPKKIVTAPIENKSKQEEKKEEKTEIKEETTKENQKVEEKKEEKTEIKKPTKKLKKEEVEVNAKSVPISTKYAISLCKFVKGKRTGDAIRDLEQVILLKKAVPMKGEYAHRKGKGMSGGKFPQRAARSFLVLVKSLAGNANNHEIDVPIITEAIANQASMPYGRFGRVRRKRTHIMLKAREMKIKEDKKEKNK
ncbi:MAG TPA: uL22 family ribosomal protein [Candidatus Pacearchaeota archaeon]|nr:uL22 family ribosomal protein [Candidatus Pacearchaeota archaeon]